MKQMDMTKASPHSLSYPVCSQQLVIYPVDHQVAGHLVDDVSLASTFHLFTFSADYARNNGQTPTSWMSSNCHIRCMPPTLLFHFISHHTSLVTRDPHSVCLSLAFPALINLADLPYMVSWLYLLTEHSPEFSQYSTEGKIKEPNLAAEAGQGLLSAVSSYARGDMGGVFKSAMGLVKTASGNTQKAEQYARATRTSPADVVRISLS